MIEGTCHCGSAGWTLQGHAGSITACNCTLCRRYGALWAYDYENERISILGRTSSYTRKEKSNPSLEILFCPNCAGVVAWRGLAPDEDGRIRIAVNVRLASPDEVGALEIDHFDGLNSFDDVPRDGRCVKDMWF